MVGNLAELQIALRSLRILEDALTALRQQLTAANPDLLGVTAPTYTKRIADLQAEIAGYLYAHPAAVSQLVSALPTESELLTA